MRLWDLTIGWAAFPHLYERRRPKTTAGQPHVEARFTPPASTPATGRTISHPAP